MDIKEYIESGILEAYVLGALSGEERADVAANIARYPELATEVDAIEAAMLQLARANAQAPPPAAREQIWNAISAGKPTDQPSPVSRTIPLSGSGGAERRIWMRAAMWIVLVGSVVLNMLLWSHRTETRRQQADMADQLATLQKEQQDMSQQMEKFKTDRSIEARVKADPAMQTVVMRSTRQDKHMAGMVYWSKERGEAYLSLHNMPMPPAGKQYQLWVIQDGKPVDMGVIANDMVARNGMMKIAAAVTGGQAFAISLENEGGSPVPTMEEIYVMGAAS